MGSKWKERNQGGWKGDREQGGTILLHTSMSNTYLTTLAIKPQWRPDSGRLSTVELINWMNCHLMWPLYIQWGSTPTLGHLMCPWTVDVRWKITCWECANSRTGWVVLTQVQSLFKSEPISRPQSGSNENFPNYVWLPGNLKPHLAIASFPTFVASFISNHKVGIFGYHILMW